MQEMQQSILREVNRKLPFPSFISLPSFYFLLNAILPGNIVRSSLWANKQRRKYHSSFSENKLSKTGIEINPSNAFSPLANLLHVFHHHLLIVKLTFEQYSVYTQHKIVCLLIKRAVSIAWTPSLKQLMHNWNRCKSTRHKAILHESKL